MEHTADTGIRIRATTLPELFSRAAWGMFSIITESDKIQSQLDRTVSLEAHDLPSLLVLWLSELNYLHTVHHELYASFQIQLDRESRLSARISGEPIDPQRHLVHTEIKAVTYHQLQVTRESGLWIAQVLFDL